MLQWWLGSCAGLVSMVLWERCYYGSRVRVRLCGPCHLKSHGFPLWKIINILNSKLDIKVNINLDKRKDQWSFSQEISEVVKIQVTLFLLSSFYAASREKGVELLWLPVTQGPESGSGSIRVTPIRMTQNPVHSESFPQTIFGTMEAFSLESFFSGHNSETHKWILKDQHTLDWVIWVTQRSAVRPTKHQQSKTSHSTLYTLLFGMCLIQKLICWKTLVCLFCDWNLQVFTWSGMGYLPPTLCSSRSHGSHTHTCAQIPSSKNLIVVVSPH